MNKKEIFNHYSEILDTMLENSIWFDAFFQNPSDFDDSLMPKEDIPCGITVASGATRTCIIDSDCDWVVKFDINDDDYGEACQRELNIYRDAREKHLDRYFTEVQYVGTYTRYINFYDIADLERWTNVYCQDKDEFIADLTRHEEDMEVQQILISLPLYAYRRATGYNFTTTVTAPMREQIKRVGSPLRSRNIVIAAEFIARYGFSEYVKFSRFGLEWEINDVHMGNIGDVNGDMVLIDFAGFHDCDDCSSDGWTIGTEDEE